jgi:hypothetical protein
MKKYIHIFLILFLILMTSGCAPLQGNYGYTKIIPRTGGKVTIQDLIDKWNDYNIYYAGYGVRLPLGVWFNPKGSDTRLVGDLWKPVPDKKTLVEITQWLYPYTQYEPYLYEILGPDGKFYGYLYYSYGPAVFKKIGENKMYVYNLDLPHQHDGGEERR